MSADTNRPLERSLTLTSDEQEILLDLLQQALGDTRVEVHHTHTPTYREKLIQHEATLRGLINRLRAL
ncbi:MAG: hypothetical protein IRY99_27125 [Isosphaeraceae bacterium]|nr:hypothetical protein [Isosphaeraceae bacterium]